MLKDLIASAMKNKNATVGDIANKLEKVRRTKAEENIILRVHTTAFDRLFDGMSYRKCKNPFHSFVRNGLKNYAPIMKKFLNKQDEVTNNFNAFYNKYLRSDMYRRVLDSVSKTQWYSFHKVEKKKKKKKQKIEESLEMTWNELFGYILKTKVGELRSIPETLFRLYAVLPIRKRTVEEDDEMNKKNIRKKSTGGIDILRDGIIKKEGVVECFALIEYLTCEWPEKDNYIKRMDLIDSFQKLATLVQTVVRTYTLMNKRVYETNIPESLFTEQVNYLIRCTLARKISRKYKNDFETDRVVALEYLVGLFVSFMYLFHFYVKHVSKNPLNVRDSDGEDDEDSDDMMEEEDLGRRRGRNEDGISEFGIPLNKLKRFFFDLMPSKKRDAAMYKRLKREVEDLLTQQFYDIQDEEVIPMFKVFRFMMYMQIKEPPKAKKKEIQVFILEKYFNDLGFVEGEDGKAKNRRTSSSSSSTSSQTTTTVIGGKSASSDISRFRFLLYPHGKKILHPKCAHPYLPPFHVDCGEESERVEDLHDPGIPKIPILTRRSLRCEIIDHILHEKGEIQKLEKSRRNIRPGGGPPRIWGFPGRNEGAEHDAVESRERLLKQRLKLVDVNRRWDHSVGVYDSKKSCVPIVLFGRASHEVYDLRKKKRKKKRVRTSPKHYFYESRTKKKKKELLLLKDEVEHIEGEVKKKKLETPLGGEDGKKEEGEEVVDGKVEELDPSSSYTSRYIESEIYSGLMGVINSNFDRVGFSKQDPIRITERNFPVYSKLESKDWDLSYPDSKKYEKILISGGTGMSNRALFQNFFRRKQEEKKKKKKDEEVSDEQQLREKDGESEEAEEPDDVKVERGLRREEFKDVILQDMKMWQFGHWVTKYFENEILKLALEKLCHVGSSSRDNSSDDEEEEEDDDGFVRVGKSRAEKEKEEEEDGIKKAKDHDLFFAEKTIPMSECVMKSILRIKRGNLYKVTTDLNFKKKESSEDLDDKLEMLLECMEEELGENDDADSKNSIQSRTQKFEEEERRKLFSRDKLLSFPHKDFKAELHLNRERKGVFGGGKVSGMTKIKMKPDDDDKSNDDMKKPPFPVSVKVVYFSVIEPVSAKVLMKRKKISSKFRWMSHATNVHEIKLRVWFESNILSLLAKDRELYTSVFKDVLLMKGDRHNLNPLTAKWRKKKKKKRRKNDSVVEGNRGVVDNNDDDDDESDSNEDEEEEKKKKKKYLFSSQNEDIWRIYDNPRMFFDPYVSKMKR